MRATSVRNASGLAGRSAHAAAEAPREAAAVAAASRSPLTPSPPPPAAAASSSIDASAANDECVGPSSERAGTASGCDGCPNQKACAEGEGRKEDPDLLLIAQRLKDVKHKVLVLSGKGGVGKTTVSRLVAKLYKQLGVSSKDHVIEVQKGDLVAGYVNQTAMKTAKKIKEARGGILFEAVGTTIAYAEFPLEW